MSSSETALASQVNPKRVPSAWRNSGLMTTRTISISRDIHATSNAIFDLLADGSTWPTWSPIEKFKLEATGSPTPNGVGSVRCFTTGRIVSREQVVIHEPAVQLSYVLLSGMPLRDYRADITLTPSGPAATTVTWHSTFEPKIPLTGMMYTIGLRRFLRRTIDGLAAHVTTDAPTK
jgi:hypothetical protein